MRFHTAHKRSAVCWDDAVCYFFAGDRYYRFNMVKDQVDNGYPQPIAGNWISLESFNGDARDIDASFNGDNGKVYFFKGSEYILYSLTQKKAYKNYPLNLSMVTWPGVQQWPLGIDAAVRRGSVVYLFNGSEYIRYNLLTNKANTTYNYPLEVAPNWSGLEGFVEPGSAFASSSLKADERTGELLSRNLYGTVPPGATAIEVELRLEKNSGAGFPFADDF